MSETSENLLSRLVAIAEDQLRWQKAASSDIVRKRLHDTLSTTAMRHVYEMCDGTNTFRDMASEVGVSIGTISSWTKKWREAALLYEGSDGRMYQLVSLTAIGLSIEADSVESSAAR